MTELPNQTLDQVRRLVSGAFSKVLSKDTERKEAQDLYTDARTNAVGERETLLTTLAAAAAQGGWDMTTIEQAVDAAKAARNDQKNTSINTFASEIKRAMHPSVRRHVGTLFALGHDAWDAEKDADDKPLRKAFSRCYHMVVNTAFNAAIAGNVPTAASDLGDMAHKVIRERELDYAKVHARLKAIRAQLAAFAVDFPVEGITTCVEFLDEVDVKDLKACVQRAAAPADDSDALAPLDVDAPAAEPAPEQNVDDAIDDALRDLHGTVELQAA